ncbi:hypothetical protein CYMTET_33465 [Cymbomonas tetramitiformis]|uniref:HIT domain-containing protein n=1 Tax=Cymbomonas tetramitiformis TaxID=36881 RepID=A0AAE0KQV5_9CHLO|nr:hypothetical protein CYMTET_33465 [Cymbomonas tetramitiformis]
MLRFITPFCGLRASVPGSRSSSKNHCSHNLRPVPQCTARKSPFASKRSQSKRAAGTRILTTMSGISYDDDNIFKKIVEGTIPCYKIFETEHALAFLDAFPMTRGHSLLIPKASGFATVMDMPEDVAANVLKELPRLAKAVHEAMGSDGVNIIQNNGGAAGQEVFHAHFHVIPRFKDDGLVKLAGASGGMIAQEDALSIQSLIQGKL